MSIRKFKIGDIVVGFGSPYSITRSGWRGYVIDIHPGETDDIEVDSSKTTPPGNGFDVESRYFRKHSLKHKVEPFKCGQWVIVGKNRDSIPKGTLAVISSDGDGLQQYVVYNLPDGSSTHGKIDIDHLKKIKSPEWAVVWSTEYNDPTMLFRSKSEAVKFVAVLKKRKGEDSRAIEIGIYKRQ